MISSISSKSRHGRYGPGKSFIKYLTLVLIFQFLAEDPLNAAASDELNCFLCHKHRGLSRVDEDGKIRLFYINRELFESSPHARNECIHCHKDINKVPHDPADKVNCTQECHMLEPSGNKKFSHKNIAEKLKQSAHWPENEDGTLKAYQQDFPGCKDCHDMPLYRPLSFYKGESAGISLRGISRCKSCHAKGNFARSFYNHVTSRLHKTRAPKEMVRVCSKCHEEKGILERHELDDVVTSYKETFHYKHIVLGSKKTPDCIDCHVVPGENAHLIESKDEPSSSVAKNNVLTTCRTSMCHEKAGPNLAGFQTHVTYSLDKYPMQFYMLLFFKTLLASVMYFFLTFIFLELLRRLFPDFSFNKQERELAKARRSQLLDD